MYACVYLCVQLNFQRKVGVMYCRAGQSTEEDMYNNESAGPAFDEFLDLLGERVRLKGWEKYRAQLDTKSEKNANIPYFRNNPVMSCYMKVMCVSMISDEFSFPSFCFHSGFHWDTLSIHALSRL